MTDIEHRVAVAKRLAVNLRKSLEQLTPKQWERPSACSEWQVQDVVSHLIGGAERQAGSMELGRRGDSNPPAGFFPQASEERSTSNAQRDIARRNQLEGRLLGAFDSSYEKLFQQFDIMGDFSWDTLCWHASSGSITAAAYVDLRIQELAIHDFDIRSALQSDAGLDPECVQVLLDMTPRWLGMCFRPTERLSKPVVYGFDINSRKSRLTVTGDEFQMELEAAEGKAEPDLTLVATGEQYLLFTYGRLTAADGMHLGRLAITGEMAHLDQFEVWFKGL